VKRGDRLWSVAAVALGALLLIGLGCRRHGQRRRVSHAAHAASATLAPEIVRVPRAALAPMIDGELEDPAWREAAMAGAFVAADGTPARPHSQIRATQRDGTLYLALYAADEDIRGGTASADGPVWLSGDAFHLELGTAGATHLLDVSPRGVLTDAKRSGEPARAGHAARGTWDFARASGARLGLVVDGTLDDASDDDEEWVVELAVPLASLGLTGARGERVTLRARRCDHPKSGGVSCGELGQRAPLVLELE
jgi:hypothetical protein